MKCVLHIGSAKTGTSTLQELLYEERDHLNANDALYPLSCLWRGDRSHNSLGIYFWDGLFDPFKTVPFASVLQALRDEMTKWPTVIVSTELIEKAILHGNAHTQTFLDMLRAEGRAIEVVYGIRRYDHFLDSLFKHSVSDPYVLYAGSTEDFLKAHAPHMQYGRIARAWRDVPGVSRVSVTPFREKDMRGNIEGMLAQIGFPGVLPADKPLPHANRSVEGEFLRLRHALNAFQLPSKLNHEFLRATTSPQARELSPAKTSLFSDEERAALLQSRAEDSCILRDDFGVDLDAWPSHCDPALTPFVPLRSEEMTDALKLIEPLDQNLFQQIARHVQDVQAGRPPS